jgi:hypothetical protein
MITHDGFWVTGEGTRTTNRGTQRRKRYMMYVIFIPGGGLPSAEDETLKRSIDLVAKTRQPRVERDAGQFSEHHQQNFRLVKDNNIVVQCYGAHILRIQGEFIDKSLWMMWDGYPIDQDVLQALREFRLDPDTLKPLEAQTMHKPRLKEPGLFDIGIHPLDEEEEDDDND